MAYQTVAGLSQADVLNKFRLFITANGWTQNFWGNEGTGSRLHIQKGPLFANFRSIENERIVTHSNAAGSGIVMNMSTGYSGSGVGFDVQPGYPLTSVITAGRLSCAGSIRFSGAVTACHFFASGDFAACVIEVTPGVYQWMMFGALEKIGTYAGGYFFTCSCQGFGYAVPTSFGNAGLAPTPDPLANFAPYGVNSGASYVYAETGDYSWYGNSNLNGRCGPANNTHRTLNSSSRPNGMTARFSAAQPNTYNSAAILFPIMALVGTSAFSTTSETLIGRMPDCRILMMDNINPATELAIGAENWMVFPLWQKGGISGNRAFAIKKVV